MSAAETTPYTVTEDFKASPLAKIFTTEKAGIPTQLREIADRGDAEIARLRALLAEHEALLAEREALRAHHEARLAHHEALLAHHEALLAERNALLAALAAKPKAAAAGGAGAAPAAKKVAGRMQNQILQKHLAPGETIYRKVGGATYTGLWDAAKGLIVCEALATGGKAASPVAGPWDSPSGFARACSFHALGMPGKAGHAVNGWDACWIERAGKKIWLKALRVTETGIEMDDDADSVASAASAPTGGAAAAFAPARAPTPPADEEEDDEEEDDE